MVELLQRESLSVVGREREAVPAAERLHAVVFWGVLALLMFAPLAFGAVEPWAIFVVQAGAGALLLVWTAGQIVQRELRLVRSPVYVPMAVFALAVMVQLFTFHDYHHRIVSMALLYAAYGVVMFLAVQVFPGTAACRRATLALASFGLLLALFALIQDFTSNGRLYWLREPRYGGAIFGPFVNKNHYAGYMEMLVPLALVACLRAGSAIDRRVLLAFAAIVMGVSIFLSGSRGGIAAFVAELAFLLVCMAAHRDGRRPVLWLLGIAVITAALLLSLGADSIAGKLAPGKLHDEALSRGAIARDSVPIIREKPWLGHGIGMFPVIYPRYRSFPTDLEVNAAHNDYVQFLVETGIAGLLALLGLFVLAYRGGFRQLDRWRDSWPAAFSLAAATACTGLLVHSAVDFNLQIPSNALLFYALLALAASPPARRGPVLYKDV